MAHKDLVYSVAEELWPQENRKAIHQRLELSFEQGRNGGTHPPNKPVN